MALRDWVRFERTKGEPIYARGATVTPEAIGLTVRWPGGGFAWGLPWAVQIDGPEGSERRIIPDVTRWAMLGIPVLMAILAAILLPRRH